MTDAINPTYYKDGWTNGAEVIDIVEHLPYSRGAAIKYLARAGKKGGAEKELEDLEKAQWYVNREIELVKRKMGLAEKDDASLKVNWIANPDAVVTFTSEMTTDESERTKEFLDTIDKLNFSFRLSGEVPDEDCETDGERAVNTIMDLLEEHENAKTESPYWIASWHSHPYKDKDLSDKQKVALSNLLEVACDGWFGELDFINVVLFEMCRGLTYGWNVAGTIAFDGDDTQVHVMKEQEKNLWRSNLKQSVPWLSREVDIFCDLIEEIYGGECK